MKIAREDYGQYKIWIKNAGDADGVTEILSTLVWDGTRFSGHIGSSGVTHSANVRRGSQSIVEILIPQQRVVQGAYFWITEEEFVLEMDKLSDVFMTPLVPTDGKPEDVTALGVELDRMRLP